MDNPLISIIVFIPMYAWFFWCFIAAWKSYEVASQEAEDTQGWSYLSGTGIIYLIVPIVVFATNPKPGLPVVVAMATMAVLGLWQAFWWFKKRQLIKRKNSPNNTSEGIRR